MTIADGTFRAFPLAWVKRIDPSAENEKIEDEMIA